MTIELQSIPAAPSLEAYERLVHVSRAVEALLDEARTYVPRLAGRTVWMVSSTARGGGVAEMMPRVVALLRELGVATEWAVLTPAQRSFFELTKRLHNLIHGAGDPRLGPEDRALYEAVSRECAEELRAKVGPQDLLVVHDPQPLGAGALLARALGVPAVWRCHIGLEEDSPVARAAWSFLEPHAEPYRVAVFSAQEYVPGFLRSRARVMEPSIDPLAHKNRELHPHHLMGVLCSAGLARAAHPVVMPPFRAPVLRLRGDGQFAPATDGAELGLLYRPVVTQISRWDRLKGFKPLLDGFRALKARRGRTPASQQRTLLDALRLVLAGPDPGSIQDDPEARETLDELAAAYRALPADEQEDVAILALPLDSVEENALVVNALQRCSTVVVQNSLREGFGLTATEAMWKAIPVMGTSAWGLRRQIRDGVDGRLVADPTDPEEIARTLDEMLASPARCVEWGHHGQRRVHDWFLVFRQVQRWLEVLAGCLEPRA